MGVVKRESVIRVNKSEALYQISALARLEAGCSRR